MTEEKIVNSTGTEYVEEPSQFAQFNQDIANENNTVRISGYVTEPFVFDYEFYGEKYYHTFVEVERLSGTIDRIPIIASDRLLDMNEDWTGSKICIIGEARSYDKYKENRTDLRYYVYAKKAYDQSQIPDNINEVAIAGTICKKKEARTFGNNRKRIAFVVAINSKSARYRKSSYINCIAWDKNVPFIESLDVGTKIELRGRSQSKLFNKRNDDGTVEKLEVYEVSAQLLKLYSED